MAIPVLAINLVPSPTFWRQRHVALGWTVLGLGCLSLVAVAGLTLKAYLDARREGRQAVALTEQASKAQRKEGQLQDELRSIDAATEQPRWRLAERILTERSLPWSRITAELERSSVQDVRYKSIQRVRPQGGQGVQIKLRLECKNREAEVAFVESVQQNPFFQGVVFEREVERQGGGLEVEAYLPVSATPPTFEALPEFGPERNKGGAASAPAPMPPPATRATPPARAKATPPSPQPPMADPEPPSSGSDRRGGRDLPRRSAPQTVDPADGPRPGRGLPRTTPRIPRDER